MPGCRAAKAGGGKRRQIQLPITWHFDNAKKLGAAVCRINDDFNSGIEPEQAAKTITYTSGSESDARTADTQKANPEQQTDWNGLIERYREYKVRTGEIKESTWTRVHRHHMKHVLEAFVSRQIQMQATSALLLLPCDDWAADWKLADQSSALPISLRYVPASAATTSGSTCTGALSGTSCGWRWRCGWRAFRMCARWRRSISRHGHSVQYVGAMELISALAKAQTQHALEARLTQYAKTRLLISRHYQRGSVLITSNRHVMEWGEVFGDQVDQFSCRQRTKSGCRLTAPPRGTSGCGCQPASATTRPAPGAHPWS